MLDETETREREVLNTPLGQLATPLAVDSSWAAEGLAVLAWALQMLDLPPHDAEVDGCEVAEAVGFLAEDAEEFMDAAELRDRAELENYRELMYAVHARLRDYTRHGKARTDFAACIEQDWLDKLRIVLTRLILNGDLAVSGTPLGECETEQIERCEQIIRERHRASIWLIGGSPVYSDIRVDT